MENLQDNSGFRNDQIGMNLSNGKTGSGDENSSVTNDWLEKTNDSVTNECGDKKIDSSENDSGKEKCLATNVSGEEKSGTPTNARGTEKKGATKICGTCGSNGSLQKCSRCKSVFYCSEECQKKDWPTHKDSCTKVLKITSEEKIKDAHKEQEKKEIGIQRFFVDRVLERAIRYDL